MEEFWSCNRIVVFGFLDSYNMWLMKVKENQQFQFFASYAIDIHAYEFQPTNKAALLKLTRPTLRFRTDSAIFIAILKKKKIK